MPTTYEALTEAGTPSLELRICTSQPVELMHLIGAFTGISNQFETFIKREHSDFEGAVSLYVREIRAGSIILELVPILQPLVSDINAILVIDSFIERTREIIGIYANGK